MIAYVDTSVLLRMLFGEPKPLAEWPAVEAAFSSVLARVELGRTIDRLRLAGTIDDAGVAELHQQARHMLSSWDLLPISEGVLQRAAGALPTALATLDAIHLATALELARTLAAPPVLATHDTQLALAASACGLAVLGV